MADLTRKTANLFDKDNPDIVEYYTNSQTGVYTYSQNTRSIIIPCQSNKTYSATKSVQGTAPRFSLSCYDNYPQENDIATAKVVNNDAMQLTLTTTANSQYLVLFFYYLNPPNASEIQQIMDTLMINEGQPLPYEPYWKHSLRKLTTATEAVENPLYSDGTAISTYSIKGNTVQDGTPTPSNPVMPNGVGERTSNLIEGVISNSVINTSGVIEASQTYSTMYAPVTSGETYTFAYSASGIDVNYIYGLFATLPKSGSITYDNSRVVVPYSTSPTITLTIPSGVSYIGMRIPNAALTTGKGIMINQGSEVATYEPYGYKIPIVSNSITLSPIYLSEQLMKIGDTADSLVSTGTVTRALKKFVFDGTENDWQVASTTVGVRFNIPVPYINESTANSPKSLCSHLVLGTTSVDYGTYSIAYAGQPTTRLIIKPDSSITTVTELKQWLADQYAAGTPLTLWGVADTPTTESVTAPSIPTTEGANSITVDTTVQPSEFTATWTGWHDSSVKEYDGSDWQ